MNIFYPLIHATFRPFLRIARAGVLMSALLTSPNCFALWTGDVLGRDLNVPGLGWLGQIGMDAGESRWDARNRRSISILLEVLNEGSVIVKSTHLDFMSRSPLWGNGWLYERYYASCERCNHDWRGVISAGWEQRNWSPSYTYSSRYTEGKMVRKNGTWVRQNAKFRCDGFVTYSYLKGLGRDVSRPLQTPRNVWQGFPYDYRWDGGV
jgi:hypothetical protein